MVIPHEPTYSLPNHNTCKQDESFVLAYVLRVCFKSCSALLLAVAGHNVSPTERLRGPYYTKPEGAKTFLNHLAIAASPSTRDFISRMSSCRTFWSISTTSRMATSPCFTTAAGSALASSRRTPGGDVRLFWIKRRDLIRFGNNWQQKIGNALSRLAIPPERYPEYSFLRS